MATKNNQTKTQGKKPSSIFQFGEVIKGYQVRVLNERELRAGAGILFVFSFFSFMNVWLVGNFAFIRIFVVAFFIEFIIRVLINPKFAPSLILSKFIVGNQTVEYVGAPQKRFAWSIGLILSAIMMWTLVLNPIMTPLNLIICFMCLTFLFFESAFGICLGCTLYNIFNKDKAKYCPGGVCEVHIKQPIQKIGILQIGVLVGFIALVWLLFVAVIKPTSTSKSLPPLPCSAPFMDLEGNTHCF